MKPVDLIMYADHSQKLPGKLLSGFVKEKKDRTWKLFLSHCIDLMMISLFTTGLASIFFESLGSVMIIPGINNSLNQEVKSVYVSLLLPPSIFLYFFFSYFLNHGQSYGMYLMKKRLIMKSKSFMDALTWSSHSTLLCFSLGISYFLTKLKWKQYNEHDYLYHNLMTQIEVSPVSLMTKIDEFEKESDQDKVTWKQAS
jgi:hypothetical protein